MARAIADMLVRRGERYMNQIGHELAQTQVNFLTTQVDLAQLRFQQASQRLLAFQNKGSFATGYRKSECSHRQARRTACAIADTAGLLAKKSGSRSPQHRDAQPIASRHHFKQIGEEKAKLAIRLARH